MSKDKKFFTPLSYPIQITLFGILGIPSNLFIIGLTFNQTAWFISQQSSFIMDALFYWAVIALVISFRITIGGLIMLKNVETVE